MLDAFHRSVGKRNGFERLSGCAPAECGGPVLLKGELLAAPFLAERRLD
jgi:hypothetical protein